MRLFKNRMQAAQELSENLAFLKDTNPVVLGLANGGVPIADVIAREMHATLDVLLIEKLYVPQYPGQCVGAVDEHGRVSVIHGATRWHNLTAHDLTEPAQAAFPEIQRRHNAIRAILPEIDVRDRAVIVVDEGVDSGARMMAAIAAVKDHGAARVIVAAPAGATEGTWQLHALANDVVIPHRPTKFRGVENFYEEYREVNDSAVLTTLQAWVNEFHPQDHGSVRSVALKLMNTRGQTLIAEVDLPANMQRGARHPAVIFAHGSESTGRSRRSMAVSERLAERSMVSVRLDFTGHGRSAGSVNDATDPQMRDDLKTALAAVRRLKEVDRERIAIIGSGTGCMIALQVAEEDAAIRALVLRGPVCNMEAVHASAVKAPTLLIHAEEDTALADAVEILDRELPARHRLVRIARTNRMFSDPGCMDAMVCATVDWLAEQLGASTAPAPGAAPEKDLAPSAAG